MEQLSGGFNSLMERYGYGVRLDPPEKKKGPVYAHQGSPADCQALTTADLAPEVRALIEELYADDFELFNYRKYTQFPAAAYASWPPTPQKTPVWVVYDYKKDAKRSYIELNMRALRRHADPSKFELHLLNGTNVRRFIPDLPKEYDRLPDHGSMSDVVRAAVLANHGGIYMDADVLVTRDLNEIAEQLAAHDLVSYTSDGQRCEDGVFSSNVMGTRPKNALSVEWYARIQRDLKKRCEFDESKDLENGVCCYTPAGKPRRCHVPWGKLGERTGHPVLKQLLHNRGDTTKDPFKVYCFKEAEDRGFAPDSTGKMLWRALLPAAQRTDRCTGGKADAKFTSECACWEQHGDLQCADGRTKDAFFNRAAFHMFSMINGHIAGSESEEGILAGPWVASRLYRQALGMPEPA